MLPPSITTPATGTPSPLPPGAIDAAEARFQLDCAASSLNDVHDQLGALIHALLALLPDPYQHPALRRPAGEAWDSPAEAARLALVHGIWNARILIDQTIRMQVERLDHDCLDHVRQALAKLQKEGGAR